MPINLPQLVLVFCLAARILAASQPPGCLQSIPPNIFPAEVVSALEFERTTWASGISVCNDPFYSVERRHVQADPGTLLKVEVTDPANYTIPPTTGLSRIVYQSKNMHGAAIPASAYILVPYSPRFLKDGSIPVVLWAHGTSGASGYHPNCAPSHHRDLWQHYMAPIPLVQQGYAVVAADYAGLGVGVDGMGEAIPHEWAVSDAQVNDMLYAFQAARQAYPIFSHQFVAVGHSQGGGAVWSLSERMQTDSIDGYQGAVAISPTTRFLEQATDDNIAGLVIVVALLRSVSIMFPEFDIRSVLTEKGQRQMQLDDLAQGCTAVLVYLFAQGGLLKPDWRENEYIQRFQNSTSVGGKPLRGPFLVIHGDEDITLLIDITDAAVNQTAMVNTNSSITYLRYKGTNHGSALWASQSTWLNWIADRFEDKSTLAEFQLKDVQPSLSDFQYQEKMTWYPEFATEFYHTP
jgi:pimeloyl-ACP methyl ester carboxylesterase